MTHPDDTLFDVGLAALAGALGTSAGWLLGGDMAFPMYCALGAIGIGAMIAGVWARERRHRRHMRECDQQYREYMRQTAIIREQLPGLERGIVEGELIGLIKAGRGI